jgi:hypothetical protein
MDQLTASGADLVITAEHAGSRRHQFIRAIRANAATKDVPS